jgi:hypothetical protein
MGIDMKWMLAFCFIFVAYVKTPLGTTKFYDNVESYRLDGMMSIELKLTTGKIVLVPAMFTVIEEK